MPAEGLHWLKRNELLSFEEIEDLLTVFATLGVRKLRFTGGEPFMRRDFGQLLSRICSEHLFESVSITTNGALTGPYVPLLKKLNIHSINLSLDTLDASRFHTITGRNELAAVMETLDALLTHNIPTKINAVIMEGINEDDLLPLAMLSKELPLDVRFIEEMPFNGRGDRHAVKWNRKGLLDSLRMEFPNMQPLPFQANATSENFHIPGHKGTVGIIAAWSRSFCGTCNRIRITPAGQMKTCLYGHNALDLRALLRTAKSKEELLESIQHAVHHKAKNGFEAENSRSPVEESMATIGG